MLSSAAAPPAAARGNRLLPWTILLVLVAAAFLAGSLVPYRVDSDIAFQLKSLDQWLRGVSPTPATLSLPDPQDLSRSSSLWSNWWPPGFPCIYAPLMATGLSLATALRLTSLLLFLAGCAGFLRLAARLELAGWGRALYAVSLAAYALTFGGATSLRTVDILSFAAGPWLALLVLRQEEEPRAGRLVLAGLALGATYWIRYALFLTALPLLAWTAWRILKTAPRPGGLRAVLGRLAALGIGFVLPVALLLGLNLRTAGLTESVSGKRSLWTVGDSPSSHLPFLALAAAGGPGLSLFQSDLALTHLVLFSDARIPFFRGLGDTERLAIKVLLGVPGTLALAWALVRARRRSRPLAGFAVLLTVCFYLELTAVSLYVGYNYLAYEPRLASGFLPLVQALVLGEWLAGWRGASRLDRVFSALGLTCFFAVPLAFAAANFAQNEVRDRWELRYTPSATGLYMPEIAQRNVPEVLAAVASTLRSSGDVVVLAGTDRWGGYSAFVPWLEFQQRTFPVAPFFAPLGTRYLAAADLSGSAPFHSERPLRVALVLDETLVDDGTLPRLQSRFPQARSWTAVPLSSQSEVAVYFSDLQVP